MKDESDYRKFLGMTIGRRDSLQDWHITIADNLHEFEQLETILQSLGYTSLDGNSITAFSVLENAHQIYLPIKNKIKPKSRTIFSVNMLQDKFNFTIPKQ
jgi:hypothetical protein